MFNQWLCWRKNSNSAKLTIVYLPCWMLRNSKHLLAVRVKSRPGHLHDVAVEVGQMLEFEPDYAQCRTKLAPRRDKPFVNMFLRVTFRLRWNVVDEAEL